MIGMSAMGIMSVLLRRKRRKSRSATAKSRLSLNSNMNTPFARRPAPAASTHHGRDRVAVFARRGVTQRAAGVVDEHVLERGLEERDALDLVGTRPRRLADPLNGHHVGLEDQPHDV